MKTGKALGFKKGDFVITPVFPGVIVSNVHTIAPVCEVWGIEHESGSVYAHDLVKITGEEFLSLVGPNPSAYSDVAKKAIQGV